MMKKDIGIGLKGPEKECSDRNCPWHGSLPVRGRVLKCRVVSTKGYLSAIVERSFHHYVPKYQRYERRKSRIMVHSPPCIPAREGDTVVVAETRPLSKTKHFVIVSRLEVKE